MSKRRTRHLRVARDLQLGVTLVVNLRTRQYTWTRFLQEGIKRTEDCEESDIIKCVLQWVLNPHLHGMVRVAL